ncbi:hypothetical protein A4A49_51032 [Nicotiana attenuata]|uniref:Uncharacterized protein n=1 Tax=Nicotiana attenuata TaxID=49451 RepID=A0A1J6J9R2_NICAT|nr:hypothetical protein A4A49_51032 [Nicotiana attenuata]
MPRGRGRGSAGRVGKSSVRGNFPTRENMPNVPIPTISPQQGGTSSSGRPDHINQVQTLGPSSTPPIQTSGHGSTPTINLEPSPNTPKQRNTIGEGTSSQSNIIGETECRSTRRPRTLLTISPTGLEPSFECSDCITKCFKHELDPNGINWKSVSNEIKQLFWRIQEGSLLGFFKVQLDTIPNNVRESWLRLWKYPKCVEKSEINAKNHCGGSGVATGTHTGGSINVGEHCKRLAVKKGRDPTPSEFHLHVHTYGNDGKSFVAEKARIVHEKYQEILQQQTQTQSDIDQCKAYYQAAGGQKKRRVYALGSQAKCYYGPNLDGSFGSDATSSATPPNAQSTSTGNLDELVMRLIPALTYHIVPVIVDRVRELVSLPSHQPNTDLTNRPLGVTPTVPTSSTAANFDEVHALGSDDDRNSPASHR